MLGIHGFHSDNNPPSGQDGWLKHTECAVVCLVGVSIHLLFALLSLDACQVIAYSGTVRTIVLFDFGLTYILSSREGNTFVFLSILVALIKAKPIVIFV